MSSGSCPFELLTRIVRKWLDLQHISAEGGLRRGLQPYREGAAAFMRGWHSCCQVGAEGKAPRPVLVDACLRGLRLAILTRLPAEFSPVTLIL